MGLNNGFIECYGCIEGKCYGKQLLNYGLCRSVIIVLKINSIGGYCYCDVFEL